MAEKKTEKMDKEEKAEKAEKKNEKAEEGKKAEKTEKAEKSSWVKMKPAELEKIVSELAEQGNSPSKIGIILRDKHGIPKAKLLGKKITKVLQGANVKYESEKEIISKRVEMLKAHISKNKHDKNALRSLAKKLWLVRRISKPQ